MRNVYNFNPIYNDKQKDIIYLDYIPEYDREDYDLSDKKDYNKFILNVKYCCRQSFEYKSLIRFLKDNINMDECAIYQNVSSFDDPKIKIEIHHDPFDLECIANIVFEKRKYYKELLSVEMVSKEVMYLHYKLLIGLIPLSETAHELVGANMLFIPLDKILGRHEEFYNLYHQFMNEDVKEKYHDICEVSKNMNMNTNILNKQFIYINLEDEYKIPELSDISLSIKQSIDNNMLDNNISNNKNNNTIEFINNKGGNNNVK